jgi:hypothetical protein
MFKWDKYNDNNDNEIEDFDIEHEDYRNQFRFDQEHDHEFNFQKTSKNYDLFNNLDEPSRSGTQLVNNALTQYTQNDHKARNNFAQNSTQQRQNFNDFSTQFQNVPTKPIILNSNLRSVKDIRKFIKKK